MFFDKFCPHSYASPPFFFPLILKTTYAFSNIQKSYALLHSLLHAFYANFKTMQFSCTHNYRNIYFFSSMSTVFQEAVTIKLLSAPAAWWVWGIEKAGQEAHRLSFNSKLITEELWNPAQITEASVSSSIKMLCELNIFENSWNTVWQRKLSIKWEHWRYKAFCTTCGCVSIVRTACLEL